MLASREHDAVTDDVLEIRSGGSCALGDVQDVGCVDSWRLQLQRRMQGRPRDGHGKQEEARSWRGRVDMASATGALYGARTVFVVVVGARRRVFGADRGNRRLAGNCERECALSAQDAEREQQDEPEQARAFASETHGSTMLARASGRVLSSCGSPCSLCLVGLSGAVTGVGVVVILRAARRITDSWASRHFALVLARLGVELLRTTARDATSRCSLRERDRRYR